MKALVVFAVLLVVGCVGTPSKEAASILGVYESIQGGFNEQVVLEVRSDGSYVLQHHFIGDVIGSDGVFKNSIFGEDRGTWVLKDGILSLVASKIGSNHSPMFLPAYCERFEVRADGSLLSVATPAIPASVRTRIVLKKEPNHTAEPASPSRGGSP